jgi:NhaP-type Na+/H+ or K+/H+ antiporter
VFIIAFFHNAWTKFSHTDNRRIPKNHQVFLWFCGLRGAVSFALAVEILGMKSVLAQDIRSLIFGTTMYAHAPFRD